MVENLQKKNVLPKLRFWGLKTLYCTQSSIESKDKSTKAW